MSQARMIIGDTRDVVASLADNSVDLIVTSPPFLALRSYLPADHPDKWREIGSEPSPADFLGTLLELTVEWRRVLAPHGSICVELGDTYSGSGGSGGDYNKGGFLEGAPKFSGSAMSYRKSANRNRDLREWPLPKSLTGIPTLYAWSLAYGRNLLRPEQTFEPWRIRNLLVWARSNPPVGALGDKFRPATSYVTIACPSDKRWFDLDAVRVPFTGHEGVGTGKRKGQNGRQGHDNRPDDLPTRINTHDGAPPLDWLSDVDDGPNGDRLWWMNTAPYAGSHYATFPVDLPARLVQAMCPRQVCVRCAVPARRITETERSRDGEINPKRVPPTRYADGETTAIGKRHGIESRTTTLGWTDCCCSADDSHWRNGVVLDPFGGSGTTGVAATGAGRDAILIDIDERNADLARERIGMFLDVEHFGQVPA